MPEQTAGELPKTPVVARDADEAYPEPGLGDAIKFLYVRRIGLAVRFVALLGIGVIGFLSLYLSTPKVVEGTIGLTFRGIERNEYPTGRKFSVEDFRSPDLITRALADAGVQEMGADLKNLAAHIFVTPIIPGDIQARWRRQEKEGSRRDEYFPNEFKLALDIAELSNAQRVRFFDALVRRYQEQVKYLQKSAVTEAGQKSALNVIAWSDTSYEKLATAYDFWDLPPLFAAFYGSLSAELKSLVLESSQYPDPRHQLAFRTVERDLNTWYITRLQALEAATYQGRLVKNREMMLQRVQYRIEDVEVRIRQKTQEADEQVRLLGVIDRPKALLAGQLSSTEKGLPIVDASALDKLIKSDYVGPVVLRISKLQEDKHSLEAEKTRLQRQLAWLPKATNIDLNRLPAGYKNIVETLSSELRDIIQNYNKLLDEYLTATVSSQVAIKQSPIITRGSYSSATALVGIAFVSFFLAIALMSIEHLYKKARNEARAAGPLAAAK